MTMKSSEIVIGGLKVTLKVRSAYDVMKVSETLKEIYNSPTENNDETLVICYATVLEDALKNNYENMKWYQYFKKRKYKEILSIKSLLNTLSVTEILFYGTEVLKLEGVINDTNTSESTEEIKKKPL